MLWLLYWLPRMLSTSSWNNPADLFLQLGCLVLTCCLWEECFFIEKCWFHSCEIRKPRFLSGVAELNENICVVPLKTLKQVEVWTSENNCPFNELVHCMLSRRCQSISLGAESRHLYFHLFSLPSLEQGVIQEQCSVCAVTKPLNNLGKWPRTNFGK